MTAPAMLLAACGVGPVSLEPPTPIGAAATDCAALIAALPETLNGLERREVEPVGPTAAYGRPAVTLRCGVAEPDALGATSQLLTVDGVDWFPEQLSAGVRFTTVSRSARLQVDAPDRSSPAADLLVDLAPAITATLPTEPSPAAG